MFDFNKNISQKQMNIVCKLRSASNAEFHKNIKLYKIIKKNSHFILGVLFYKYFNHFSFQTSS